MNMNLKLDSHQPLSVLVVEDSDEDFVALTRVIAQISALPLKIHRCKDGDDALDFLHQMGKYDQASHVFFPELIILDLNLPGTDGREVLVTIKQSETLKTIPVVVLSTSANPKDITACYEAGANSYMLKPMDINGLKDSVKILLDYWFKLTVLPTSVKS